MSILIQKTAYLSSKAQIVLFSNEGILLDTCNTLLDIIPLKNQNLWEVFPMLESIEVMLSSLQIENEEMYFPRVELTFKDKHWLFDFTFYRHSEQANTIVWILQDFTQHYEYLRIIQQERNEAIANKERTVQTK
ncbi:MAG: hypothetical protein ACPG49_10885 [Chitinophagales bacterium]